ncbi:MAG: hypothetical protein IPO92_20290 [Saprospiraceae bacterium]|nr:hypothetical protein [Saprospiraceae bacterium]
MNVLNCNLSSCHEYGVHAKASSAEPKNVSSSKLQITGINSPYQMFKGVGYYAVGGVKTDIVSSFFANINYLGVQIERTNALNHSVINSTFNKAGSTPLIFGKSLNLCNH